MRILVVEDDKDVAGFVVRGLKEAGHNVEHADNGRDGLFMAASEAFDAVILDPAFGREMEAMFSGDIGASRQITPEAWARRGLGERIGETCARMVAGLL